MNAYTINRLFKTCISHKLAENGVTLCGRPSGWYCIDPEPGFHLTSCQVCSSGLGYQLVTLKQKELSVSVTRQTCINCGQFFEGRRGAKTCSTKCRKALGRKRAVK